MPYRTYEKRVKNYELAVNPDVVRTKFTERKPTMVLGQQEFQSQLVAEEIKVRTILDKAGIAGVARVPYLNFMRAMLRAAFRYSGAALRAIADAEEAKFTALGLDATLLSFIKDEVVATPGY